MSWDALSWAEHTPITVSSDKFVLICIANYTNKSGESSFPSVALIARFTALSRASVQRSLRRLERDGYIKTSKQYRKNRQTTNLYTITWRGLTMRPLSVGEGPHHEAGRASPRGPRGPHHEAQNLNRNHQSNLSEKVAFEEEGNFQGASEAFKQWEKTRALMKPRKL